LFDRVREGKHGRFSAQRTKIFPREHRASEEYIRGIFVDPRHRWGALANQRQKLRASFFLTAEYALDGETGGAATEAQILQRNESRDIHMPRGALNTEGPKNQNPRPFAQTARDKDGVPGLLRFTSWAATPAAQDLRGGSTQRAGHSVHRVSFLSPRLSFANQSFSFLFRLRQPRNNRSKFIEYLVPAL
jgi:hypothetical protein